METAQKAHGRLPGCSIKNCLRPALWNLTFQVPGEPTSILETTIKVCDTHRDSTFCPWAEIIFSQPGMRDDVRRQMEREGKPVPDNLNDLIPVFTLAVIPVVIA